MHLFFLRQLLISRIKGKCTDLGRHVTVRIPFRQLHQPHGVIFPEHQFIGMSQGLGETFISFIFLIGSQCVQLLQSDVPASGDRRFFKIIIQIFQFAGNRISPDTVCQII